VSVRAARYRVHVRRGESQAIEATHEILAVAWTLDDGAPGAPRLEAFVDWSPYFRSGCKPFQALPLVERGHSARFGLGPAELAVMCASHNGAAEHVAAVRRILAAIGLDESALGCGFHFPEDPENDAALRAGRLPRSPLYHNCSGKHAGMLALAVAEGWPTEDYVRLDHPVQRAAIAAVAEVCGVDAAALPVAIDGCSAANPALPLSAMACGFARFAAARAEAADVRERALATLRAAMAEHPVLVAGERRLCTEVMRATRGAVVTKTGAEGLQCAAIPAARTGLAVKVRDGARRAVGPAVVAALDDGGWLDDQARAALAHWRRPPHYNHRGIEVGQLTVERVAADALGWETAAHRSPAVAGYSGG
jgi:L-asparaginase II